MKCVAAVLLVVGHSIPCLASEWRLATPAEVLPAWVEPSTNAKNQVAADFDGNGITDVARILVSPTNGELSLFVMMNEGSDNYRLLHLHPADGLGIDLVPPGTYQTTCDRGYACSKDEPPEVTLHRPGLNVFKWESASWILYWDDATHSFSSFGQSD